MGDAKDEGQKALEKRDYLTKILSEAEILDDVPDSDKGLWIDRHGKNFDSLYTFDKDLHDRLGDQTSHSQALKEIQEKLAILSQDQDLADRLARAETRTQAFQELQEKISQK